MPNGLGDPTVQDPSLDTQNLDSTGSTDTSGGTSALQSFLASLPAIGWSVASAATGRPLVQTPYGPTLGAQPMVTGQININSLVIFGLIGVALYALLKR